MDNDCKTTKRTLAINSRCKININTFLTPSESNRVECSNSRTSTKFTSHNSLKYAASWCVSVAACCGSRHLSFSWSPLCRQHWGRCQWAVWQLHDQPRLSWVGAGQIAEPDSVAFLPCRDYTTNEITTFTTVGVVKLPLYGYWIHRLDQ